jgi:hypothetical protein
MTAQNEAPGGDQLKLKLTIAVDENPDLYHALRHIKDPRRRTRRLKDLAVKGLMLERAPASIVGLAPMRTTDGHAARAVIGESVSSMLEWEDSTAS